MPTITDPNIIGEIIQNQGVYFTDPQAYEIYIYFTVPPKAEIQIFIPLFFVSYARGEEDELLLHSKFALFPILLWSVDSGITEAGKLFLGMINPGPKKIF